MISQISVLSSGIRNGAIARSRLLRFEASAGWPILLPSSRHARGSPAAARPALRLAPQRLLRATAAPQRGTDREPDAGEHRSAQHGVSNLRTRRGRRGRGRRRPVAAAAARGRTSCCTSGTDLVQQIISDICTVLLVKEGIYLPSSPVNCFI